jgi:hypothetical protein
MNAKPPLYAPYKEFQYDAASDVNADGTTHLVNMFGRLDGFSTSISGLEIVVPSVLHGIMQSDRQTIQNLQHDVEDRSIIQLLNILEDAQCPNYMLYKILQLA